MKKLAVILPLFLLSACTKPMAPEYGFLSHEDNIHTYDYKLSELEKREDFLWPKAVFPQTTIARMPDFTTRDYLVAINLAYGLKALPKEDNSFILPLLNRSMLNFTTGDYHHAFRYLINAKQTMDSLNQEGGIIGTEQAKIFKGEVYEQGLVALYLGFLFYEKEDYQNARAMFTQAIELDRESIPEGDAATAFGILGNDNRIAYYMLARTYQKLGDENNSRVSLTNSVNWQSVPEDMIDTAVSEGRFLPVSHGLPILPVEFNYADFDSDLSNQTNPFIGIDNLTEDNLVLIISLGSSPKKVLGNLNFTRDYIAPTPYLERSAKVYVDGELFAEAYPMYNHFHQAAGMHRTNKDSMQMGKALLKGALTIATSLVGSISQAIDQQWNVAADGRYWGTVPNEIHLASGRVKPGLHTIKVEFFDKNNNPLPHYQQILHYVPVKNEQETLLHVRAIRDRYNATPLINASRIEAFDVVKKTVSFNAKDFKSLQLGDELSILELVSDSPATKSKFIKQQGQLEIRELREMQAVFGVPSKFLTNNFNTEFDTTYNGLSINKVATIKINELSSSTAKGLYQGVLNSNNHYFVTKSLADKEVSLQ